MAPTTSTRAAPGIDDSALQHSTPAAALATWPAGVPLSTADALALLSDGPIEVVGRLVDASNATFYCSLAAPDEDPGPSGLVHAVYKPTSGERPLNDFPDGTLAHREVAAWLVSEASGLGVVPPTILRAGPLGPGMLQLWIEVDEEADPFMLVLMRDPRLRRIALLDLVMNNADRKTGHLLPTLAGAILGCDHGICFSSEPKLRTVLWGWAGEPFGDDDRAALAAIGAAFDRGLGEELDGLLSRSEVDATRRRLDALVRSDRFPVPVRGRRAIPWPPF